MRHLFLLISLLTLLSSNDKIAKDEHFTVLNNILPLAKFDIRYFSNKNFLGRRVKGYQAPICYLSNDAASALKKVQIALKKEQLQLTIFDCYRPQRAVDDFVLWAKELNNITMKSTYYPHIHKKDLFKKGYIAAKSGHSRGSTVDLSINTFDMGSPFDYFDPRSNTMSKDITQQQHQNRMYLKKVMEENGFKNYAQEWWHYTLKDEPFKERYFDFIITK